MSRRRLRRLSQGAGLAAVSFLGVLLLSNLFRPPPSVARRMTQGKVPAALEFAGQTLGDNGRVSLAGLRGKAVFLAFWASWCGPCKEEVPELSRFAQAHADQPVAVLGIATRDSKWTARAFAATHIHGFASISDSGGQIADAYGVSSLPELFVVSPEGFVVLHIRGIVDRATLDSALQRVLG
jgi:cytochrome c biogenesis protein CcmG/thiol:disulfide interchange protein DsbE